VRRLAAIWRRPVAADSKIKRALLFDNPGLDNDARAALETFLFLVDQATHKSKLHLVQNLRDAMREGSVSIFRTSTSATPAGPITSCILRAGH
jgi:hypothetical protein